jgi:hypothetical protein
VQGKYLGQRRYAGQEAYLKKNHMYLSRTAHNFNVEKSGEIQLYLLSSVYPAISSKKTVRLS